MLACTALGDITPAAAAAATNVQLVLTSVTTPAAATAQWYRCANFDQLRIW